MRQITFHSGTIVSWAHHIYTPKNIPGIPGAWYIPVFFGEHIWSFLISRMPRRNGGHRHDLLDRLVVAIYDLLQIVSKSSWSRSPTDIPSI